MFIESCKIKNNKKAEFGDFQTSHALACEIIQFLKMTCSLPSAVVEPTCGLGSFLKASIVAFESKVRYYGFDINPEYIQKAKTLFSPPNDVNVELYCEDFFKKDWKTFFSLLPENILVVGNLPWVTNSKLGSLESENLPEKNNFQQHKGFAAKTGKANFDISEWMLIKLLESLNNKKAYIAMLCKIATARKVLSYAWKNKIDAGNSSLHRFDAKKHFGVSVDACLFIVHTDRKFDHQSSVLFGDISFKNRISRFGIADGDLVSDVDKYELFKDIDGFEYRKWRSGVKHDAAKVMEFTKNGDFYINGFGESCTLEDKYIYPLLKSSDIANNRLSPHRFVLLTQKKVIDNTDEIRIEAPKTWQYLIDHAEYLDKRKSSIYNKRSRFSIFGIGNYTFAPWKVAISGFYKNFSFKVIGNLNEKPIVMDDTCYFIPCESYEEADFFAHLLNSEITEKFIKTLVFFDAKRPINIDILKRIDLKKIAERMNLEKLANHYLAYEPFERGSQQLFVFENQKKSNNALHLTVTRRESASDTSR